MASFKFAKDYIIQDDGTEDERKTVFVPLKIEQKGKLLMDPMVESLWKSKDYSAHAQESISLVGKSTGMPEVTVGGFAPQTTGIGEMKLEAPPRHSGKRQIGSRIWLTQMEWHMKVMRYTPADWLDVVAIWVEGTTSS